MTRKPIYEELEQRVKELDKQAAEHKRTEEALQESEEQLSAIAEKSPIPTAVGASDSSIISFNEALEELTGYRRAEITDVTDWANRLYPDKEYRDFVQKNIQQALRGEKQACTEFTITCKDGSTRTLDFHTSFFKDGLIIQMVDVTQHKRAEEILNFFKSAVESSSDAIGMSSPEGKHWYQNKVFNDLFGGIGTDPPASVYVDEKVGREVFKTIMAGDQWTGEVEMYGKDKKVLNIFLRAYSIKDHGKVRGLVGVHTDIMERKRAEKALRASETEKKSILNAMPDIVLFQDTNLSIQWGNEAAGRSVDKAQEELVGCFCYELWHGRSEPCEGCPLLIALETGSSAKSIMTTPDERWWEIAGEPVCDMDGKVVGAIEIARDITEKKKLEARLQRAQTMETIGTLAGGVAHDLNNILSGLISYPELLLLEIPEDSPLRNSILTIQKSGEKAAAIVQDLLTLARRGVAVTEVVNLNLIISEYVKSPEHERLISFHPGVQVKTNLEADVLNILGSPAHLSKTVMNLVSNAAEAMTKGGTISISTENRYIDRAIRGYDSIEEGDYVILTVSDTGVGILPTDMERIFEPFYTKKVMGRSGTGLGMAVVWGTVKDHKGYIDVQSTKGKGTTFSLYFPVTRKELAKDKALLSIEDYMGKGESILVVDDVEEQRVIATKILRKLGYCVTTVSSGEEAVDYLKDNSADLLILDMIMDPGIDGLETYKRIIELRPGQKALIVSGFSETKRVKKAQKLGAGAYVKKPFLLEKIGLA